MTQNNNVNTMNMDNMKLAYRYITLESDIAYDWDDYNVWGAVFYDMLEDKIVTTNYGHGTSCTMSGYTVKEAIEAGYVTAEHLIDVMFSSLGISLANADIAPMIKRYNETNPFGMPVEVVGGRKFKGHGYLVGSIETPVRYGLGAWHNAVTYRYIVFSPEKNDFFIVNSFAYFKFDDATVDAWNKAARANVENTIENVHTLAHAWAYNMSYSACDTRNYYSMITRYSNGGISSVTVPEILAQAAERKAEQNRIDRENKMNAELPKLIEWVRSKGYKETEEEIVAEAKRIWNKNN